MKRNQSIISYLLAFVLFAIAVKLLGLVHFNNYQLLAVVFVGYGAGTVYSSMGNNRKLSLFLGTIAFLVGIIFLLIGIQDIFYSSSIFFPSMLFILGIGGLMLFIDNIADKTILLISIILIVLGFIYTAVSGNLNFSSFIKSLYELALEYWLVILVVIIVIFLVATTGKDE